MTKEHGLDMINVGFYSSLPHCLRNNFVIEVTYKIAWQSKTVLIKKVTNYYNNFQFPYSVESQF